MERLDEECMAKKTMKSDVKENRCKGRPRLAWMDCAKRAWERRVCQWSRVDRMHWIKGGSQL